MTARPLVAVDLDGTLIYSARSLMLPDDDVLAPRLAVTEVWRGAPLTFATTDALALLAELDAVATVVPVTTRTRAQYARVRLLDGSAPTSEPAPRRYAVVANGGHLLVDGIVDEAWATRVRAIVDASCGPLAEVVEALLRATHGHRAGDVRVADDLFAYVAVDRATLPPEAVNDLSAWCAEGGWRVSVQGRRVYCVPEPLTKSAAVGEVARRTGCDRVIAAGDSLLDAELLESADAGVRPAHGELHEIAWRRPHVAVTGSRGVLAGEEILRRLLERARGHASDEIVSADTREGERTHV
jgi:phosphoglycolate phosphatase-like HAD superfamily hydrolase